MNWIKRRWHKWRYKHPSRDLRPLSPTDRPKAIEHVRRLFEGWQPKCNFSKKKAPFKPPLRQIAFTQLSVCLNASLLTKEARWLRLRHYFARAFVLAKLAQEEFGKIYLLDQAALLSVVGANDVAWHRFWQDWHDHKTKSLLMKLPFMPNSLSDGRLDYEEDTKFGALYVELSPEKISVPAVTVTREMADEMIEICDWSEIHAFAKVRDLPLINAVGGPSAGVEALLATYFRSADTSPEEKRAIA